MAQRHNRGATVRPQSRDRFIRPAIIERCGWESLACQEASPWIYDSDAKAGVARDFGQCSGNLDGATISSRRGGA